MPGRNMPTKRQFAKDPQANEIRTTCLNIASLLEQGKKEDAQLFELRQRLVDMGIDPNMCTGQPEEFYKNPLNMTRYIAGQVLDMLPEDYGGIRNLVHCYLDAK